MQKRKVNIHAIVAWALCISMPTYADLHYAKHPWKGHSLIVVGLDQTDHLSLVLNDTKQQPYLNFDSAINAQVCSVDFAMNAGMFHADFSPVGLYIENSQTLKSLNLATKGQGNFLIQPNGVLSWDENSARISTTAEYQKADLKPRYATQSGPMLVISGKINPNFIADSDFRKIRNGVGITDQTLWFVISEDPINFYDFADFFRTVLKAKQALYLDGGRVPSLYLKQPKILKQYRFLGPMFIYQQKDHC